MHGTNLEFYCDLFQKVALAVIYGSGAVAAVSAAVFIVKAV